MDGNDQEFLDRQFSVLCEELRGLRRVIAAAALWGSHTLSTVEWLKQDGPDEFERQALDVLRNDAMDEQR